MSPERRSPMVPAGGRRLITADRIVNEGRMIRDDSQLPHARDLVREFAAQALDEGMTVSDDVVAAIKTRIAQIDQRDLRLSSTRSCITPSSSSSSRRGADCIIW